MHSDYLDDDSKPNRDIRGPIFDRSNSMPGKTDSTWSLLILVVPAILLLVASVSTLTGFDNTAVGKLVFILIDPFLGVLCGPLHLLGVLGVGIWLLPANEMGVRRNKPLIICIWIFFTVPCWLISVFVAGLSVVLDM